MPPITSTTFELDALSRITEADRRVELQSPPSRGMPGAIPRRSSDPNGAVTTTTYDATGDLLTSTGAGHCRDDDGYT